MFVRRFIPADTKYINGSADGTVCGVCLCGVCVVYVYVCLCVYMCVFVCVCVVCVYVWCVCGVCVYVCVYVYSRVKCTCSLDGSQVIVVFIVSS